MEPTWYRMVIDWRVMNPDEATDALEAVCDSGIFDAHGEFSASTSPAEYD